MKISETKELIPVYQDKRFDTREEFEKWLVQTTYKKISFSDLGQDMQNIWVAKSGEILHCDFHGSIYNGSFVDLEKLEEFTPITIYYNDEWKRYMGLVVDSIDTSDI